MATGGPDDASVNVNHDLYNISYIVSFGDQVVKEDGNVSLSNEQGVSFSGAVERTVSLNALRWVSKTSCGDIGGTPQACIVVSYLDDETKKVGNVLFTVNNEEMFAKCFDKVINLLELKYNRSGGDDEQIDQAVKVVLQQPIIIRKMKMSVHEVNVLSGSAIDQVVENSEGSECEFFMILDIECACLYQCEKLLTPKHQLMFWKEETSDSIERVKLVQHKQQTHKVVYLQTNTMSFGFDADQNIIQELQNLSPKEKYLMTNPPMMVDALRKLKPLPSQGPSHSLATGFSGSYLRESCKEGDIARRIEGELSNAEVNLAQNEDMQNFWVAIEFDIKEIMDSGTWPTTDFRSGGMNPNSGEHLEKALNDVMDQLKENKLPVAISRLQASRELFEASSISDIRHIFAKSDMDLLRLLYFRSLCG